MSKSKQTQMFPKYLREPFLGDKNSEGSDRWYYLHKPLTDEMLIIDDVGNWAWTDRDTIRNTPHVFNTQRLAKDIQRKFPGTVVIRYLWEVK